MEQFKYEYIVDGVKKTKTINADQEQEFLANHSQYTPVRVIESPDNKYKEKPVVSVSDTKINPDIEKYNRLLKKHKIDPDQSEEDFFNSIKREEKEIYGGDDEYVILRLNLIGGKTKKQWNKEDPENGYANFEELNFLLIIKPTKNDPIIEIIKLLFINNLKKVAR